MGEVKEEKGRCKGREGKGKGGGRGGEERRGEEADRGQERQMNHLPFLSAPDRTSNQPGSTAAAAQPHPPAPPLCPPLPLLQSPLPVLSLPPAPPPCWSLPPLT